MSARMLRRALQSNPAADSAGNNASSGPSTSDDDEGGGPVGNPFDLLGVQDEEGNEGSDFERDANQQSDAVPASTSAAAGAAKPVSHSQSKRKKSKNKKKGKKDSDSAESIEKLVKWVTAENGKDAEAREGKISSAVESGEGSQSSPPSQNVNGYESILMADPKHLRAEDELRRIFGAKVINAVDRQEGAASQRRRQPAAGRRAGRCRPLKKSVLVGPREDWIRWNSGISMECVKIEGTILHFRYQHSKSYQEVQHRFDACVASHDPNTIVALLRSAPYHVDALLAMSEFHKQFGDHQQSALYLEQCLYSLESAWHPYFTPSSGCCRLEFAWAPNKALFIALFRHMQTLEKRGCHRTALELCKFLLSLDPSDPLGAFFCIDFFAVRAEQYEWLEKFAAEYKTFTTISLLPNFAFSLAVARYHLESGLAKQSNGHASTVRDGDGDGDVEAKAAVDLLRQALMLYPSTLKKIVVKAPVKEDLSWSKILSLPPFDHALEDDTELDHLVDIYVDRNGLIWRSPELQGLLKDAASSLTQTSGSHAVPLTGAEMNDYDSVRQNILRSVETECKNMRLHVPDSADSLPSIPLENIALFDEEDGNEMLEFFGRHLEDHERQRAQAPRDENGQPRNTAGDDVLQEFYRATAQGGNAFLGFLRSLGFVDQNSLEAVADDAPVLLDENDGDDHDSDEERPTARNGDERSP